MGEHEGEQVKREGLDLPCGPVIKNLSANNAGDMGSLSSRGTKIPQAVGQLSPWATTTEPTCSGACMLHLRSDTAVNK